MVNKFTGFLGAAFLLFGIAGMTTGGHDHNFIVFGVNAAHNTVHLVSGAVAVWVALASAQAAGIFCFIFGGIYLAVAAAGFLNVSYPMEMLNLNMADNFLHLLIGASCIAVAFFDRSMAVR